MEGKATLREIEEFWSIDDVEMANDALDAYLEASAEANRIAAGAK